MKKAVKLYKVTFIQYTNSSCDTVSNMRYGYNDEDDDSKEELIYLSIPEGGLVIREDEINDYQRFGHGIDSIQFVGSMFVSVPYSDNMPNHGDL